MSELILSVVISVAIFSGIALALLRFTSAPGIRFWSVAAVVVLSYPIAFTFGLVCFYLRLPWPDGYDLRYRVAFMIAVAIGPPCLAWTIVRFAVAVLARPRRITYVLAPIFVIILIAVYLRVFAVPWRELDYQAWRGAHPNWGPLFTSDHRGGGSSLLIARAHVDYVVSEGMRHQRPIFNDFWRDTGDQVYLRFIVDYHIALIYCYSKSNKKFLWKAWWPIS